MWPYEGRNIRLYECYVDLLREQKKEAFLGIERIRDRDLRSSGRRSTRAGLGRTQICSLCRFVGVSNTTIGHYLEGKALRGPPRRRHYIEREGCGCTSPTQDTTRSIIKGSHTEDSRSRARATCTVRRIPELGRRPCGLCYSRQRRVLRAGRLDWKIGRECGARECLAFACDAGRLLAIRRERKSTGQHGNGS